MVECDSRECPFDENNAAKLYHAIRKLFAYQRRRLLHNLTSRWAGFRKADLRFDVREHAAWEPPEPGK
jgi:hypothetical protein